MNYIILGINGEIGKSIFNEIYNKDDNFILTYNLQRPNIKKKNIFLLKLDFKKVDQNRVKISKVIQKYKKIDFIINNAGNASPYKDALKVKLNEFEQAMKINFYSPLYIIMEMLNKSLKLKSRLNIINISSNTIKFFGSNKNLPYLVSKIDHDLKVRSQNSPLYADPTQRQSATLMRQLSTAIAEQVPSEQGNPQLRKQLRINIEQYFHQIKRNQ